MLYKKQLLFIYLLFSSIISACSEPTTEIKNPFQTYEKTPLDKQTLERYQKRSIDKQQSSSIIAKIKQAQVQAKQQDGGFSYQDLSYNESKKTIEINQLALEPEALQALQYMPQEDFDNIKNIQIKWFDSQNEIPHFIHASMADSFTPKNTFLATQDGKNYQSFFQKLKADGSSLNNLADFAYEYNEKQGEIKFALNDNFHQLFDSRLVIKIDGISKTMLDMLSGNDDKVADPSLFLGMLSGIRVQEVYLKMKMERTIDEIFNALPKAEAQQARQEYNQSKQLSEEKMKKMAGKAFSLEQLQTYQQSWFNFLEQKQAIIISMHPDVPQALPTFFTAFMMGQNNPKILANLFKQLNLKISNQDI